jgi:ketosteroid isomerase-like protein
MTTAREVAMADREEYDTITEEFLEAYIERQRDAGWDGEKTSALLAPDIIWIDPALPEPARSPEEVAEYIDWTNVGFPDLRFESAGALAISMDSKTAYFSWTMKGTHTGRIDPPGLTPTGRSVELPGVDEYRFRDGKLAHYVGYYDRYSLLHQLGLMPPVGGAAERFLVRLKNLDNLRRR